MKKMLVTGMLVLLMVSGVRATLIDSVYNVPSGGATVGHSYGTLPGFADDFGDSYAYFTPIHASGGNLFGTGGQSGYGWVVYKFQAAVGETISDVALDVTTYCSTGDIDIYWTADSYDGLAAPDFANWTDTGFYHRSWGAWVKTDEWGTTMNFQPSSSELYLAYRFKPGSADYQAQMGADRLVLSTIPEPATMCLVGVGGFLALCRKRHS